ncbi:hypothetical protein COOONC_05990 [Cooperia oncophora]
MCICRDGVVSGSSSRVDSRTHRRVPKQISHRLQTTVQRSAAVPVGQAPTTLLVRHPLAVRRQLAPPRTPPRFQGVQPEFDDFRRRQRPVTSLAIRRAQIRRVPLSQATHIRKPTLLFVGNLSRPTSHKDILERPSRPRTVPLPPVEPPRQFTRHRLRVRLQRPTNKQLTDLRTLPRTSSMSDGVVKGETAASADVVSDSDVERAVLKAIIESSTTSSRRNGRIRRPHLRTFPHSSDTASENRKRPSPRKEEVSPSPIAPTARNTSRRITSTTKAPELPPVIDITKFTSNATINVNPGPAAVASPSAPSLIAPQAAQSTPGSPLLLFTTSRRRVTSLTNRAQGQQDRNISRGLHRQSSTTQSHHSFTSASAPPTSVTSTQPTITAVPPSTNGLSTIAQGKNADVTLTSPRRPPPQPLPITGAPPTVNRSRPSVPSLRINNSAEAPPIATGSLESELRKPTEVMSETAVHRNLVDHSTSNEDSFDVEPAVLNRKTAIVAPLRNLPLSEVVEGSADIAEEELATVSATSSPTTTSPTPTTTPLAFHTPTLAGIESSTVITTTRQTTTRSTPFPLTSLQDISLGNGGLKEELNQNLIQGNPTSTLVPPPGSPPGMPAIPPQEAGAPGAAPPNDSVVEELNRAENFMEVMSAVQSCLLEPVLLALGTACIRQWFPLK